MGLGIFDFCTHSRRLIAKDSIFSPNFSCGCSYAKRALWCRDSKRRALGNYFSVRICYEFLISKCSGDWDLGLCTFWVLALINPKRVLKEFRWFIRHLSSMVKSAALKKSCYPQVPGSIPAENTSTQRQLRFTWIWANRLSSKGSKLLFPVIKAI